MAHPKSSTSYPAEFFAFFEAVGTQVPEVIMTLETRGRAVSLRSRLYAFRKCLEREGHPAYAQASLVEIVLRPKTDDPEGETLLIGRPAGNEMRKLLKSAGVKVEEILEGRAEPAPAPKPSGRGADTDDLLGKFYADGDD